VTNFSHTIDAIQQGIDRSLHSGVQIFVSVNGQPVPDEGIGEASPGQSMTSSTMMLWRSAGKPVTAAAICRLVQDGQLSLQTCVREIIEEVPEPLGNVTILQLLTHASGMQLVETGWPQASWNEILKTIIAATVSADSEAAYQPQTTWFLLGEILKRKSGGPLRSFSELLTQDVLTPLNMTDSFCGIPAEQIANIEGATYYTRERGSLVANDFGTDAWLSAASPGGNLRGPVNQLGRFYEMLRNEGHNDAGDVYLETDIVRQMTSRHRVDQYDQTLQHTIDMGLGLIIDSNHHGIETVPYGFGRHCSARTFGHGGSQCAMGFCDPENSLVVAWAANGFCGEGQHQRRNRAINEAVYVDLGLSQSEA